MDFLRWHVSLDIDDMITLLSAVTALVAVFAWKRTYNKERSLSETVDAPVLDQFLKLTEKVTEIKLDLASARDEIAELREQISQYIRDEAAYQAELHAKDVEIEELRAQLYAARDERDSLGERVAHLEDVCRRAGINGDEE